ncbi:adhesion G protein-coupled receptor E5-like [Physella acuta]|uniref:adhesion G protein-coupled receptor E5-like n=1 Tax=Physella acuta TaxID=109671 RepID=UPI0027DDF529|nr:adhesion G protein-coupled receptor E5-like [Physella acuta]
MCDHLTTFAVLISSYQKEEPYELNVLTQVGCSLSIASLTVTIIVNIVLWGDIKDSATILHINKCSLLLMAYVTFVAGVDKTSNTIVCRLVAVILQFTLTASMFFMLAEAIELYKNVVLIFYTRSILKYLLIVAYGLPTVIVAAFVGATQGHGYGDERRCWVKVDTFLFWGFSGIVIGVCLANFVILVRVMHKIQTTKIVRRKSCKVKIITAIRALAVLTPLLGVGWIIGVFAVNEYTMIFQYLFTIMCSFQGFMIFLTQTVFNKKVRQGLKKRFARATAMCTRLCGYDQITQQDIGLTRRRKPRHDLLMLAHKVYLPQQMTAESTLPLDQEFSQHLSVADMTSVSRDVPQKMTAESTSPLDQEFPQHLSDINSASQDIYEQNTSYFITRL